jgi:hypothetical protein
VLFLESDCPEAWDLGSRKSFIARGCSTLVCTSGGKTVNKASGYPVVLLYNSGMCYAVGRICFLTCCGFISRDQQLDKGAVRYLDVL